MKKLLTVLLTVLIAFTTLSFNVAALETDIEAKKDDVTEVEQEGKLDVIEEEETSFVEEEKGEEIMEPEVSSKEDEIKLDKDPLKETVLNDFVSVSASAEMVTDTYELVEYGETIDTDAIYVVATANAFNNKKLIMQYAGKDQKAKILNISNYTDSNIKITHNPDDVSFEMKLSSNADVSGTYFLTHVDGTKTYKMFFNSIIKFQENSSHYIYLNDSNNVMLQTSSSYHLSYDSYSKDSWCGSNSDSNAYTYLYKKSNPCVHEWNYSLDTDSSVIKAECHKCHEEASFQIIKPTLDVYGKTGTGISEKAILVNEDGKLADVISKLEIEYYSGTDKLSSAPTDAGIYTAKATVKGANGKSVTASVEYTIAKAQVHIENLTKYERFTYNGGKQDIDNLIKVKFNNIELTKDDDYEINYFIDDDRSKPVDPINASKYSVIVHLKEDGNYCFYKNSETSEYIYNNSPNYPQYEIIPKNVTVTIEDDYIKPVLDKDGKPTIHPSFKTPIYYCVYDGNKYNVPKTVTFNGILPNDKYNYQVAFIPPIKPVVNEKEPVIPTTVDHMLDAGRYTMLIDLIADENGNRNYCFENGYDPIVSNSLTAKPARYAERFQVTVDQAQATLSFKGTPYDYNEDGVKPNNEDIVISYKDRYNKDVTVSGKDIVKVNNTYYTEKGEAVNPPKEPGNYYVAAVLPTDNNFFIDVKESKPVYSQEKVTFTINKKATVITPSIDSVTYNGRQQRPTITFKDKDGTIISLRQKDWFGGDYSVSYRNNVNAGEGIATITLANDKYVFDGDKVKVEVKFTINPRVTNVSINNIKNYSTEYSGRQFVPNFDFKDIVERRWTKNADYTVTFYKGYNLSEGRISPEDVKDAGMYSVLIKLNNPNYRFPESYGPIGIDTTKEKVLNFTITKATLTASLIIPRNGYTYDGEAKEPRVLLTGFKYYDEWVHGNEYVVDYGNSIDAGDKHAYVHLTNSLARNYTLVGGEATADGNIDLPYTIARRPLTVVWPEEDKFEYNGKEQPIPVIIKGGIVTKDLGHVQLDTILSKKIFNRYVSVKESVDVGSYKATAILTGNRANNYVLAGSLTKTYEITPKLVKIVWSGLGPYVYDGKVHGPSYQFVDPKDDTPFEFYRRDGLVHAQFDIPVDEKPDSLEELMKSNRAVWQNIDAGKYVSIVLLAGEKETNYTFTGCNWGEALPGLVGFDVDFEIQKRQLSVVWGDKVKFSRKSKAQAPEIKDLVVVNDEGDAIVKADVKHITVGYDEKFGPQIHTGKYVAKAKLFTDGKRPLSNYELVNDSIDFRIYSKPNEDTTPVKTGVDR